MTLNYIVFDLEFNQDFSKSNKDSLMPRPCFEIIQIGAVKLDQSLNFIGTFQRYVKPVIYPQINPFITELTGITTEQLQSEEIFPGVYQDFIEFIGNLNSVFCIWGISDIKELFRNVSYHKLNQKLLTKSYINLQPYAALHFKLPRKKLLKLKTTVEMLDIPSVCPFHNALNDAKYTAEILKKIFQDSMRPKFYDPNATNSHPRQRKQRIDFEQLTKQFEKMYQRELTQDEQNMIKLAYQMGKTRQFLKL